MIFHYYSCIIWYFNITAELHGISILQLYYKVFQYYSCIIRYFNITAVLYGISILQLYNMIFQYYSCIIWFVISIGSIVCR